jgi:hypothetical protein
MIGCIDNVANDILFYANICFGIELVNLILLSYIVPMPVVTIAHQPCHCPVLPEHRE